MPSGLPPVRIPIPTVIRSVYHSFLPDAIATRTIGATILDSRKSIDITAVGLMVGICLIWALQPIGLKSTAVFAAPVLQIGLRSGIAALCVLAIVKLKGQRMEFLGGTAGLGALAGLL